MVLVASCCGCFSPAVTGKMVRVKGKLDGKKYSWEKPVCVFCWRQTCGDLVGRKKWLHNILTLTKKPLIIDVTEYKSVIFWYAIVQQKNTIETVEFCHFSLNSSCFLFILCSSLYTLFYRQQPLKPWGLKAPRRILCCIFELKGDFYFRAFTQLCSRVSDPCKLFAVRSVW